jgi:UDP:flavonoid glycosyltransferase YjiC (YdhE family)
MKPLRILIPVFSPATGTWGGLTRVLAVARAAQSAGHTLAFCAAGPLAMVLRDHGYTVYPTPQSTFFGLPRFISQIIEKRSQEASIPVKPGKSVGSMWMVYMLSGMNRRSYLQRALYSEWMAAMDFEADAIFTDYDPGAYLLALCSGLPIASCFQSVVQQGIGSYAWKTMNQSVAAVLASQGQPPVAVESVCFDDRVLKLVPSIPELDGGPSDRPDLRYVGQLLGELKPASPETSFIPEPGKRYVFVYTGTGSVSLSTIREVLPKVFTAEGPLQAVVAGQSIYQTHRIGGVEFRPFVSANEILPHCDWTICHGGQNTIIQSLMHGVPLMVIPGAVFERRFNAEMVHKAGAGRMGELPDFNPDWIRSVLAEREPLAKRASELGSKIKSYGGPTEAVAALEEWAAAHPAPRPLPALQ